MEVITYQNWQGHCGKELAEKELTALLAVAAGKSDKQYAQEAGVSPRTIKGAVERCMHKLHVYKRAALVGEALRRGLIAPAACAALALLIGIQHQPASLSRRPEAPRRVEMRVTSARDVSAWVA